MKKLQLLLLAGVLAMPLCVSAMDQQSGESNTTGYNTADEDTKLDTTDEGTNSEYNATDEDTNLNTTDKSTLIARIFKALKSYKLKSYKENKEFAARVGVSSAALLVGLHALYYNIVPVVKNDLRIIAKEIEEIADAEGVVDTTKAIIAAIIKTPVSIAKQTIFDGNTSKGILKTIIAGGLVYKKESIANQAMTLFNILSKMINNSDQSNEG